MGTFLLEYQKNEGLILTNARQTACLRHADAARFAFFESSCKMATYENGQLVPTAIDLHRELNALKKTDYPWMYAVSMCAPQEALRNFNYAYAQFFRRLKEKKAGKNTLACRLAGVRPNLIDKQADICFLPAHVDISMQGTQI